MFNQISISIFKLRMNSTFLNADCAHQDGSLMLVSSDSGVSILAYHLILISLVKPMTLCVTTYSYIYKHLLREQHTVLNAANGKTYKKLLKLNTELKIVNYVSRHERLSII